MIPGGYLRQITANDNKRYQRIAMDSHVVVVVHIDLNMFSRHYNPFNKFAKAHGLKDYALF